VVAQGVGAAEAGPHGHRLHGQVRTLQEFLGTLQPLVEEPRSGVVRALTSPRTFARRFKAATGVGHE
jgi:hypothetical protein